LAAGREYIVRGPPPYRRGTRPGTEWPKSPNGLLVVGG
jgi:hypothetical protein